MTERVPHAEFPSDETLAAFVDGRLDPETRRRVVEHIATCAECYDVVLAANAMRQPATPAVVPFRRRYVLIGVAAAAAITAIALFLSPLREQFIPQQKSGLAALAAAAPPQRNIEGRLSGFPYRPLKPVTRGAGDEDDTSPERLKLLAVAAQVAAEAKKNPTPENLHAYGVSLLMLGKWDAAVNTLEEALRKETREQLIGKAVARTRDVALLEDLSAAYLAIAQYTDRSAAFLSAADCAQRAWTVAPSAGTAWNRAIAIEHLHLRSAARAAWNDYLKLDSRSAWADEARKHLGNDSARRGEGWRVQRHALVSNAASMSTALSVVREFPQDARVFVEDELLPAWGSDVVDGRLSAAADSLARAEVIAAALAERGDPYLHDVIRQIVTKNVDVSRVARAFVLYGRARAAYTALRTSEASSAFVEARQMFAQARSQAVFLPQLGRSMCAFYNSDFESAVAYAKECRIACRMNYQAVCAQAEWMYGLSNIIVGRPYTAHMAYMRGLERFTAIGERRSVVAMENLLAESAEHLGRENEAQEHRMRALSVGDDETDPRIPVILAGSCRYALHHGLAGPLDLFSESLVAATKNESRKNLLAEAYAFRGCAFAENGKMGISRIWFDRARRVAEEVPEAAIRERTLAAVWAVAPASITRDSDVESLSTAIEKLSALKTHLELSDLLTRRGDRFLDAHDVNAAINDYQAAVRELVTSYRSIRDFAVRTSFLSRYEALLDRMVLLSVREHDPLLAVAYSERSRAQWSSDALPASAAEEDATRARERVAAKLAQIPSDTAILCYVETHNALVTLVLLRNSVFAGISNATEADIRRLVDRIDRAFRTTDPRQQNAVLADAFALLIEPQRSSLLNKSRLVFVADRDLNTVPFAALRDAKADKYLAETAAVAVSPSAPVAIAHLDGATHDAIRDAAVIGNPQFDRQAFPNLPNLEYAASEAQQIAAIYEHSTLLIGRQADKMRVVKAARSAQLVHLACHAIANPVDAEASFLVLSPLRSDDGLLYGREVLDLRLPQKPIVVLSACRTATAMSSREIGYARLASVFLAAGASAVVGSLRDVSDADADTFTLDFHNHLHSSADLYDAFRTAQVDALHISSLPSSWSAFVLVI